MLPLREKVSMDPTASFSVRRRIEKSFGFLWHLHPEIELTLIVEGRGTRFVGDDIAAYEAGDLVLLGSNLPHTWQAPLRGRERPHHAVCAQFSREFLGAEFFNRPELGVVSDLLNRATRGLVYSGATRAKAAALLEPLPEMQGLPRLLRFLEVLALLAKDRGSRPLSSVRYRAPASAVNRRRIDEVCRFLSEHFREPLSLEDVAAEAHMSPTAFARFFRQATNRTLTEYVNELRIGHACDLLMHTDKTIAEAAYAAGYANLAHFNRRFLRSRGRPPKAFRAAFGSPENHRGKAGAPRKAPDDR